MTYVTLINTPILNCSSDNKVISKDQVRSINDLQSLVDEMRILKDKQVNRNKEAEQHGFNAGYDEGLRKSQIDAKKQFSDYLAKTAVEIEEQLVLQRSTIVDLAIEITKKIVSSIDSEEIVLGIASKAVTRFKEGDTLKVQVNCDIAENIKTKLYARCCDTDVNSNIEIVANPNLDVLDCIIKSEHGEIDASFTEQINTLKNHLVSAL
jgi:flagellar biosynthesis/type III secretory pathway protein FliH